MVYVNTDDLSIGCFSSRHNRESNSASAGEDDFGSFCIPGGSQSLYFRSSIESACVVVFHIYAGQTQFFCRIFSTLNKSISESDNSRNCHSAHEAQFGVAIFNSCITSQITGLFFCKEDSYCVGIGSEITVVCIVGCSVNQNEVYFRIQFLSQVNGFFKQESGGYDHFCSTFNSQLNGSQVSVGALFCRFVVLMGNSVFLCIRYNTFPCSLVEGLVIDGSYIRDHGDIVGCGFGSFGLSASAGSQREDQNQYQQNCYYFFHLFVPPIFSE